MLRTEVPIMNERVEDGPGVRVSLPERWKVLSRRADDTFVKQASRRGRLPFLQVLMGVSMNDEVIRSCVLAKNAQELGISVLRKLLA